jgi:hypothetical protein
MRFKALRTVATAALLCATGAAPALRQAPGSNVVITQCDPHLYNNAKSGFQAAPYKSGQRAILALDTGAKRPRRQLVLYSAWSPVENSSDSARMMECFNEVRRSVTT